MLSLKKRRDSMVSAHGFSALVRGWQLALSVRGLRPHTVQTYARDVERFTGTVNGHHPKETPPPPHGAGGITGFDLSDLLWQGGDSCVAPP